jgi:hypothetical protein
MLFDIRGRGRRRTVQGVYLGLALLLGGGLVLFGVGAGNGNGGLLNAFNGGGSSSNQNQVASQQERSALKAVKLNPSDPSAWSSLLQARWAAATQGNNYNSTTATFTSSGKQELTGVTQAWQRYTPLTKTPYPLLATLSARAYAYLRNYAGAANAWELETAASPGQFKGYECLAVSAYAAKQTRKGDLALTKAMSLAPKAQRTLVKTQISQAKTQPTLAQQC